MGIGSRNRIGKRNIALQDSRAASQQVNAEWKHETCLIDTREREMGKWDGPKLHLLAIFNGCWHDFSLIFGMSSIALTFFLIWVERLHGL